MAFILKNNACILKKNEDCESGMFYDTESDQCQMCDVSCLECSSFSSKSCLACPQQRPYLKYGECVARCGDGYYLNKKTNQCFKCKDGCKLCVEQDKCGECKSGFSLNENNECVQTILNGKQFEIIQAIKLFKKAGYLKYLIHFCRFMLRYELL